MAKYIASTVALSCSSVVFWAISGGVGGGGGLGMFVVVNNTITPGQSTGGLSGSICPAVVPVGEGTSANSPCETSHGGGSLNACRNWSVLCESRG